MFWRFFRKGCLSLCVSSVDIHLTAMEERLLEQRHTIEIQLYNEIASSSSPPLLSLFVDERKSIAHLKDKISEMIHLSPDRVRISGLFPFVEFTLLSSVPPLSPRVERQRISRRHTIHWECWYGLSLLHCESISHPSSFGFMKGFILALRCRYIQEGC